MKKYIQITAGRGPVECARAVTLVAKEMLKANPTMRLVESEPHNTEPGCFMSMTFSIEVEPSVETLPSAIAEPATAQIARMQVIIITIIFFI